MFYRKILLFFFLISFCTKAFPAVFVVTSNADSGPGTLRDALTQAAAADSSFTNYINFNISDISEAGRTILLTSQLPDIVSNLVIDGTTQPGDVFGVSSAKVALFFITPVEQTLSGLRIVNKHDITILGLYIKNLTDVSKATQLYFWKGIEIINGNNIVIGQARKGNVITGFYIPITTDSPVNTTYYNPCRNISLKGNFFDIDADGETHPLAEEVNVSLYQVAGQVKIGGLVDEGNLMANGLSIYQQNSIEPFDTVSAYINIQNNKIGVDFNLQNNIPTSSGIQIGTVDPDGNNTCTIEDNIIAAQNSYAINIGNNGAGITILRNYIGTDKSLKKSFKTGGIFIYGASGDGVAIGNTDPANANFITNCLPVNIWPYSFVTVNKNSFFCTTSMGPMHLETVGPFAPPLVSILKISANSISGTATPNSSIELFYSDKCGTCSPQTYFASVNADEDGKWLYNGAITGTVIASATLGKNTSEFTRTTINIDSIKVVNVCTNDGTGSITGAVPLSAINIKWVDENGNVVGTNADLLNVKIGKYKLLVSNGACGDSTTYFEINNNFQLDTSNIKRTEPSCNNLSGAINGINLINNTANYPTVKWLDVNNKIVSTALSLQDSPAGNYYLSVTSNDGTCSQKYGPFTLKNSTGPTLNQSKAVIQPASCSEPTGSVTGIAATGSGTLKYSWKNAQMQEVATTIDLLNQPPGVYTLQLTDGSQCGPSYTSPFTITGMNDVKIDESNVVVVNTNCTRLFGSISNIKVTGTGTLQFAWVGDTNAIDDKNIDLTNVPPGKYRLMVTNGICDPVYSAYYTINLVGVEISGANVATLTQPKCGSDGAITGVDSYNATHYVWKDSSGKTVGNTNDLLNVPGGDYQLTISDDCGHFVQTSVFHLNNAVKTTYPAYPVAIQSSCEGVANGAISVTTDALVAAVRWANAAGQTIGNNAAVQNLAQGTYQLYLTNQSGCESLFKTFVVTTLTTPSVSNTTLCSSGRVILSVNNPVDSALYNLYDNLQSSQPLLQSKGGRFNVNITGDKIYYISQVSGFCESSKAEIDVSVGLSPIDIANTFTPNNDGINDFWIIKNIISYPNASVKIFNRNGQQIYNSVGYSQPFDGTYNGKKLPVGVYYYIINLSTSCNILSGSLTIIR